MIMSRGVQWNFLHLIISFLRTADAVEDGDHLHMTLSGDACPTLKFFLFSGCSGWIPS
jgi:hypothetical protein